MKKDADNKKDEKEELLNSLISLRNAEKEKCLNEINDICNKYSFKLECEVVVSQRGVVSNIFLTDL